jgi:DNA-binding transcriptional ArsR family regulator
MDEKEIAGLFKVLSVDTRLNIVKALKQKSLCVNALAARLGVSQSAVSQHLRILKSSGLVTDNRAGYFIHYTLNEEKLKEYLESINKFLD